MENYNNFSDAFGSRFALHVYIQTWQAWIIWKLAGKIIYIIVEREVDLECLGNHFVLCFTLHVKRHYILGCVYSIKSLWAIVIVTKTYVFLSLIFKNVCCPYIMVKVTEYSLVVRKSECSVLSLILTLILC